MTARIARIATLITAGISLAVTAGFTVTGDLPVLLAVPVAIAITVVTILGEPK